MGHAVKQSDSKLWDKYETAKKLWLTRIKAARHDFTDNHEQAAELNAIWTTLKKRFAAIGIGCLMLWLAGCATTPASDLPNLKIVDAGFYRSGQPTAMGFKWLEDHENLAMVLKLNTESEGTDSIGDDSAAARFVTVVNFPITFDQQLGLDPIDLNALAKIIEELPHYGTLIHCQHGEDRTGLAVAMHRVLVDGWTTDAAEKEMLANGFHTSLAGLWYAWHQFKKQFP